MPQESKSKRQTEQTRETPAARTLDELAYLAPSPQVQTIRCLADWLRSPRHPEAPPVPRRFHAGCIITPPVTVKQRDAGT